MRIALVADLHGNRPATERLEQDLKHRGADRIWCLGDAVGKGPDSVYTCDWVKSNCDVVLRGNWDEGVAFKRFPKDVYYWKQLGEKRMNWLGQLPLEHRCLFSGNRIRLFHGRPVMEHMLWPQNEYRDWEPYFDQKTDTVIYADSHKQGLRLLGEGKRVVNTGSVGNGTGINQVQYCLMEGEADSSLPAPLLFMFPVLPYDNEHAARDAAMETDLPGREAYIREIRTGVYSR